MNNVWLAGSIEKKGREREKKRREEEEENMRIYFVHTILFHFILFYFIPRIVAGRIFSSASS